MGKIDYFHITLNKQNPVYFSGEPLSGCLDLRINERFKINSVKMLIKGFGKTEWTQKSGSGSNKRTRYYSAEEYYLNLNLIFTSNSNGKELYLERGEYSYPFEINLPVNLPTSFEHDHGRIRYSLVGTVDIPLAIDSHTETMFTVISHYDLNQHPELRQSHGQNQVEYFCCCCCKSDPINADFSLLKTGYVSGEIINFKAIINNQSNKDLNNVFVSLIQNVRVHAEGRSKLFHREVRKIIYSQKVNGRTLAEWTDGFIQIPPVCASSTKTSRIIEIFYTIVFNFGKSGLSLNKQIVVPITIGTIPFQTNENNFNNQMQQSPVSTEQVALLDYSSANQLSPPSYSYAPCIFENNNQSANNSEEKGKMIHSNAIGFRPQYIYAESYSAQN